MTGRTRRAPALLGAGAVAAMTLIGGAAAAQERAVPSETAAGWPTVSFPVAFRDLDLRTDAGKNELIHRVKVTANYVCNTLRGMDPAEWLACRDRAVTDGMAGVREVVHQARAHAVTWAPGPAWTPPPK